MYTISPSHGGRKHSARTAGEESPVYEEEDEEEEGTPNVIIQFITKAQTKIREGYQEHEKVIWRVFYIVLLLAYAAYFAYAMYYHFGDEGSIRLLWVTCLVVFCVFWYIFFNTFGETIWRTVEPCTKVISKHEELVSW